MNFFFATQYHSNSLLNRKLNKLHSDWLYGQFNWRIIITLDILCGAEKSYKIKFFFDKCHHAMQKFAFYWKYFLLRSMIDSIIEIRKKYILMLTSQKNQLSFCTETFISSQCGVHTNHKIDIDLLDLQIEGKVKFYISQTALHTTP